MEMEDLQWTNDLAIRLIQEYGKRPELWNPMHEMYRVQTLKYETWKELASLFECEVADLRKKLNSLFASYRREKIKVRAGGKSFWFLYDHMDFLPTHVENNATTTPTPAAAGRNLTPSIKLVSRAPVKEVPPPRVKQAAPSSGEEEVDDDEEDPDYSAEFLEDEEEEEPTSHVIVKEEPLVKSQPSFLKERRLKRAKRSERPQHKKPRISRSVAPLLRRRIVHEHAASAPSSSSLDERLSEALKLLRKSDLSRRKDECDSFGEYIADSLRKHDDRTQSMIKQAINNILFEQEMKKYNSNQQYVVISEMEENPLILHDETDK